MWILIALLAQVTYGALPPTCDSKVYCYGPLLHTVQMARIYNDSKTFVDLKIKTSEEQVLNNFDEFMKETNNQPTKNQIEQFVQQNFEDGKELVEWTPPDFNPEPAFLNNITNDELKNFGKSMVGLWKILARKMIPDVAVNPQQYSLLPLPNGFVIPGGRFKEIYYWDTYWIIRGLLISDMSDTARGMIDNLLHLVKKYGHVPNGSRLYYIRRSQPPLLTKMVMEYIKHTKDLKWLKENIDTLEQELLFWIKNRSVWVKRKSILYRMFHYNATSAGPRPESYREDYATAMKSPDPQFLYTALKSGAESGWDYSSRWFFDKDGGNHANLTGIDTVRVIPVDLNAILCDAFSILSKLFGKIGDTRRQTLWAQQAKLQELNLINVLWNDKIGVWLDYDLKLEKHRPYFYPSNLTPLMTSCCSIHKTTHIKKILAYIRNTNITHFLGGTPTSLINSGEQWDYPNAWPPLQSIIIFGLRNTNNKEAQDLAFELAQKWLNANLIGFKETKEMFEKYDAEVPGRYGGGGEYTVQSGFGWTNGVVLELLNTYGSVL